MSDNFLKIKNGIGLKPKNLATIVNPAAGDVACDESDNKIKFYDVSTSTWKELGSGGGAVDSVNGQTGTVVLTKSDVGLSNVDNTSDANKPISTATQTALNNINDNVNALDMQITRMTNHENIPDLEIDWNNFFNYKEIATNSTFTFSNLPNSKSHQTLLVVKNTGASDITLILPVGLIKRADFSLIVKAGKINTYTFIYADEKIYTAVVTDMVE